MSIASISAATQRKTSTENTSSAGMGKDDFLQLMIAQLENQDPLNPQDASEYTSQLCQFSSLEQLINANDQLGTLSTALTSGSRNNAAGYIGHDVTVFGNQVTLDDGTATTANFDLSGDAADVKVNVYDSSGAVIDTVKLGELKSGSHAFSWDGKNSAGSVQPDGTYTFKVVATDKDGLSISYSPTFTGKVDSISFENGKTMVNIAGESWPLECVVGIK